MEEPTLTERHRIRDWGSAGTGTGQFNAPADVAVDAENCVCYVADTGNDRIQKFSLEGGYLGSFTGLSAPRGVCVDGLGRVWVADTGHDRVLVLNWPYSTATVVWDSDDAEDPLGIESPIGLAAETVDGVTSVYVIEDAANQVRAITADVDFTEVTQTFIDGPADPEMTPSHIALHGDTLYVTDTANSTIQKFTRNGGAFEYAESCGTSGTGEGELNSPTGICVYTDGRIFVCDKGENDNYRVQRFSASGPAAGAFEVAWGDATMFNFTGGAGIAVGPDGYIFVTDTGRNRIRRFQADNSLTFYGMFDGAETEVKITKVNAVEFDPANFTHFDPDVRDSITAEITYTPSRNSRISFTLDLQEPVDDVDSRLFKATWTVRTMAFDQEQSTWVVASVGATPPSGGAHNQPVMIRIAGLHAQDIEQYDVEIEESVFSLEEYEGCLYIQGRSRFALSVRAIAGGTEVLVWNDLTGKIGWESLSTPTGMCLPPYARIGCASAERKSPLRLWILP